MPANSTPPVEGMAVGGVSAQSAASLPPDHFPLPSSAICLEWKPTAVSSALSDHGSA
jgi:hypothetical protein